MVEGVNEKRLLLSVSSLWMMHSAQDDQVVSVNVCISLVCCRLWLHSRLAPLEQIGETGVAAAKGLDLVPTALEEAGLHLVELVERCEKVARLRLAQQVRSAQGQHSTLVFHVASVFVIRLSSTSRTYVARSHFKGNINFVIN